MAESILSYTNHPEISGLFIAANILFVSALAVLASLVKKKSVTESE